MIDLSFCTLVAHFILAIGNACFLSGFNSLKRYPDDCAYVLEYIDLIEL